MSDDRAVHPAESDPLHFLYETLRQQHMATPPNELVARLAQKGFRDGEIAEVLHRPETEIAHLRTGETTDQLTRTRLTGFMAACEAIEKLTAIADVPTWFRTRIDPAREYTPLHLADKHIGLELDYAAGACGADQTLARMKTWWIEQTSC
ncbi:hypothetical protein ACFYWN_41030 [Streptomyces sp. NPDC002917]|uniref:hypothetical protein n=1 Tax=Streptomyces sp. NPDC002917 TaxID=3364671 RepID=UPI0036B33A11